MSRPRREGEGGRVNRKLDRIERRISFLDGIEDPNDWERAELAALFPELALDSSAYPAARMTLKAHEAKVLLSV